MPQFIIHQLSGPEMGGTTEAGQSGSAAALLQNRGHPICLVECQQIIREPVIAPETCEILPPPPADGTVSAGSKKDSKKNDDEFFRSRKPITVSMLSEETDLQIEEHKTDAKAILLERNLISILVTNPNSESQVPQTLELHFNLGFDRFFLVGTPCKLLLSGVLRLHQPCLEVVFGLNMLQLVENTMIFVNENVVDVYSKLDAFEHVHNRRRLAYNFYGSAMPDLDGSAGGDGSPDYGKSIYPDYLIYFEMNARRRAVALFTGQINPPPSDAFRPIGRELVDMYPARKFGEVVKSSLHVMLVMGEAKAKDRKFILSHANLTTLTFQDKAVCHVCGWSKAYFSFSQASIRIGGYVALISPTTEQLITGQTEVKVRSGTCLLYVDDYFAFLRMAEDTDYDVEQSTNKQKELKSISLMNINKKRHRTNGAHGYV